MRLEVLPTRTAGAAENMAVDFLLLRRYPRGAEARFRHYGWRSPAFTFGYAQKIALVREQLPAGQTFDLCRRPTGGGIVDHREDWTYSLVIPRGHRLEELRATHSYRSVHQALLDTLEAQGVSARLEQIPETGEHLESRPAPEAGPKRASDAGVCFQRAEIFDVVHAHTRQKIAGAAQKRTKEGLLFQGSIWRPAVTTQGQAFDWDRFENDFVARLGATLELDPAAVAWPEFNEDEVDGLIEQYSSPEWLESR